MTGLLETSGVEADAWPNSFQKATSYFAAMDSLIYLKQNVSYRAVRLSPFVTVLLHPKDDRAIGIKIKGMRHLMERARATLASANITLTDSDVLQVMTILETAITANGDAWIEKADDERKQKLAAAAKKLAREAGSVPAAEFLVAA
ncbi:MAG TPA: hypothetical protein VGL58_05320 [Caulobacteraceae bacterium]|jgi:hypothetical protein